MGKILVTSALPYANGPVHFGHVAGAYLPADVYVRYRRACGDDVLYICGSDEHGAPITANAAKAGQEPGEFAAHWAGVIQETFSLMGIEFDNFSRTSLPVHHKQAQEFFKNCEAGGHLEQRTNEQAFCTTCEMFLPDRYLVGTCPKCSYENARGDECPKCAHWVEAGTLINPRCKTCDSVPENRETSHWYLKLDELQPKLVEWLETKRGSWKPNVLSQIDSWLKQKHEEGPPGLRPRPVTRDLSWGIPVPVEGTDGKVLYVWFDAPIGYISSTMEWAEKQGTPEAWKDWWLGEDVKLLHFLGKDNIVFHTLIWPATLMCQPENYVLPHDVPANEFYNLQGDKFNTTAGWYIDIADCFSKYPTDAVRYTIARNAPETSDSEWTWEDFQAKVNGELNDAYGNLAQRALKFLMTHCDGKIPEPGPLGEADEAELKALAEWPEKVGAYLDKFRVRAGVQEFMELARRGNRYFNEKAPWKARKTDEADFRTTMHTTCRILAALAVLGRPFLPTTSASLWSQLGFEPAGLDAVSWGDAGTIEVPAGQALGEVAPLFEKISNEAVAAEIQALEERKAAMCGETGEAAEEEAAVELAPFEEVATFDDFIKVDLRAGKVLEAEELPKSKKLLKLKIDLGIETRQVLAGIKQFYTPEEMVGRMVAVVANLAPRKMMGEESQGMVLATTDPRTDRAVLVDPGPDAVPGSRIS